MTNSFAKITFEHNANECTYKCAFVRIIIPYPPATNGQAERFIQTFKNKLTTLKCTGNTINTALPKSFMVYRRAIHPATGKSPSMLMLGRQIQSRLQLILPQNETQNIELENPTKQFLTEEKVAARDYLS